MTSFAGRQNKAVRGVTKRKCEVYFYILRSVSARSDNEMHSYHTLRAR